MATIKSKALAAVIALIPALAVLAGPLPTTTYTACPPGLVEDPITYACTHPSGMGGGVGAPTEGELTQCSGRDRANCLEEQYYGPPA
jgi:hypothetical protein